MGFFYVGVIIILRFFQSYFGKKVSDIYPKTGDGRFKYIALSMTYSAILGVGLILFTGQFRNFSWINLLFATLSGLSMALGSICGSLALQSGTMVLSSVMGTAGLIVPCVAGILFFGEPVSVLQWIGIAVFIGAAYLLSDSAKQINSRFSFKTVLLLIGSFFSNGITMLCQKLITFVEQEPNITLFSLFTFAIPAIIFGIYAGVKNRDEGCEKLDKRLILPTVILSVAVFIINQFATAATGFIPSAVLFALINGGATIISALVGAVCFRERMTPRAVLGLVIGLGAIMMINIF